MKKHILFALIYLTTVVILTLYVRILSLEALIIPVLAYLIAQEITKKW